MTPEALLSTEDRAQIVESWHDPGGLRGFLSTVDHFRIGRRYLVTALCFLVIGGVLALLMRVQLAFPENQFLGPDAYNRLFTAHGSTMMFLFAVPVMQGLGLCLVPLMIGTRDAAFPRLNAYSYYMFLFGGIFFYTSFALNMSPDTGWTAYAPLSGPEFAPGKRVDVWAQLVTFTELSSLGTAVSVIVTILKHRAPGMSLDRMPLFVWAQLVTSFMVVFAMPSVMVASALLALDRLVGTHFFNASANGDVLLWQHLFWFFGHPEVYIIFLPALGTVSAIVVTFSRRAIFGYTAMVLAMVAIGMLAFGLWVHHMFTTGLPELGQNFFSAASMVIAVPTGVQIFCWIATLWTGRCRFDTPLWFVLGFFAIFVMGGLSGVMLASVPLDTQLHDTYFVVAHFHYVLIGGAVFPLLGGLHYWFPKLTGRALSERLGKLGFGMLFVGFNLTFFPLHQLGLHGMPRRVYTYLPNLGWNRLNLLATGGAFLMAGAFGCMLVNALCAFRRPACAADPWGGDTLEWDTENPPPQHKLWLLPIVASRHPRWEPSAGTRWVVGMRPSEREILITGLLDAAPDHRVVLPKPALSPLLAAL
ncbi:MAG: cytochrome c oxidase subunit I, partial [Myxococcota bacterium]|nr:cytochrome c oxidase subunit I [Myxococcota bacterium]